MSGWFAPCCNQFAIDVTRSGHSFMFFYCSSNPARHIPLVLPLVLLQCPYIYEFLQTAMSLPHKSIGVAVIWNAEGRILIDRRLPEGEFGNFWEFPGGKIEDGETPAECVRREVREELGIEVEVGDRSIEIVHDYPRFRVTLYVHHCQHVSGMPQLLACQEVRWVSPQELLQFTFPPANRAIVSLLVGEEK